MAKLQTNDLFYAKETERFYSIFCEHSKDVHEAMNEAIHALLNEENTNLYPKEIANKILEQRTDNLSAEYIQKIQHIIDKTFTDDPNTGMLVGTVNPIVVGTAHYVAQKADIPVLFIAEDLSNLRAANHYLQALMDAGICETLGRENMDKITHIMSDIIHEKMQSGLGEHVALIEVKSGGDEYTKIALVKDTDKFLEQFADPDILPYLANHPERKTQIASEILYEKYPEILQNVAMPAVNLKTAQLGLNTIKHSKIGKPPGVSIGSGCATMNGDEYPSHITDKAEKGIKINKMEDAALRYGLVNEARVEDYLKQVEEPYIRDTLHKEFKPITLSDLETLEDIYKLQANNIAYEFAVNKAVAEAREDLHFLMEITQERWQALSHDQGAFHERCIALNVDNPKELFAALAQEGIEELKKLDSQPRHKIDDVAPFEEQKVIQVNEIAASLRLRKAAKALGLSIADEKESLIKYDSDITPPRYRFNGDLLSPEAIKERGIILQDAPEGKYKNTRLDSAAINEYLHEVIEPRIREQIKKDFEPVALNDSTDLKRMDEIRANHNAYEKAVYDEVEKAYQKIMEDAIAQERTLTLILVRTMNACEAQNQVSRMPSTRFAVVDAERIMDKENAQSAKIDKVEIGNLGGFNAINQQLGDAVLREFGKIMREEVAGLGDELRDRINSHDVGNGRIVRVVTDQFPEKILTELQNKCATNIEKDIFDQDIIEFARKTYANPRSKGQQNSDDMIESLQKDIKMMEEKYNITIEKLSDIPNPGAFAKRATVNRETVEITRDMTYYQKIDEIIYAVGERPGPTEVMALESPSKNAPSRTIAR